MKMISLLLSAAIVLAHAAGCGKESISSDIQMGERFDLAFGQSKYFDKGDFKIYFSQIMEDSRCPEGATCVWAGQVRMKMVFQEKGKDIASTEAKYQDGKSKMNTFLHNGYAIEIMSVSPKSKTDRNIPVEEYSIGLKISKANS